MIARLIILGGILLRSLPGWSAEQPLADIYVSTAGHDSWSGRLAEPSADGTDGPLATLERARLHVAQLRQQQPGRDRPVLVSVRGGVYYLDQPLVFGPDDSGTERSPTIYRAFGDERPVLSGGVRITHWQVTADGRWQTTLDDVQAGEWYSPSCSSTINGAIARAYPSKVTTTLLSNSVSADSASRARRSAPAGPI
jgi:hypothetical protein